MFQFGTQLKQSLETPAPDHSVGAEKFVKVGYMTALGNVTWYTDNFCTVSQKPKPSTDIYVKAEN